MKNEVIKELEAMIAEAAAKPFVIMPFYAPEGDTLQVHLKDCSSYAKWITPEISIFYSNQDDSLVGFEINHVSWLIEQAKLNKLVNEWRANHAEVK